MSNSVSITRRNRKRILRSGQVITQTRYVVNYREPCTGQRKQLFFIRQKDAQEEASKLTAQLRGGDYSARRQVSTVVNVMERWLEDRSIHVKPQTLRGYRETIKNIIGPLIIGTSKDRAAISRSRKAPARQQMRELLGHIKVQELTTSDIRAWHRMISTEVGAYTANRAKMFLNAALALNAEDTNTRPPTMPTNLGRSRSKAKKAILSTEQIASLISAAKQDRERGIYIVFPFLVGTRPSEQLGLLWDEVDFDANVIRICRMQERDGTLTEMTKTEASTREIPMCDLLRAMLIEWRLACPRKDGKLHRVFPGLGSRQPWPLPRKNGGGALVYHNFNHRFWIPALKQYGLPHVTPHSARHSFISTLQAQGIEVGLVAKIAGHASAAVTLGHYTQAVRGGETVVGALDAAFGIRGWPARPFGLPAEQSCPESVGYGGKFLPP